MTHFLSDIPRQPNDLRRTIDFLLGAGRPALDAATNAIRGARHVYLTEDVNLLAKIRSSGVTVVGITNSEDGPFAREVQIPLTAFGKPLAVGVTVIVTGTALPAFTPGGVAGPATV